MKFLGGAKLLGSIQYTLSLLLLLEHLQLHNALKHWLRLMALRISKQLPSGWPQLTPAWPLTHRCITLWSRDPSAKFGGHRAFLKNLTSGWPWLTPAWPLTQQWVTLWSKVLPTKFGGHRAFLSNFTSSWPWLTPAWPLTPAMHYALVRGSSHQIWWP